MVVESSVVMSEVVESAEWLALWVRMVLLAASLLAASLVATHATSQQADLLYKMLCALGYLL